MGALSLVVDNARSLAHQLRVDSVMATTAGSIVEWLTSFSWLSAEERKQRTAKVGLYHRVVWAVPDDALADGWRTVSGTDQDVTVAFDADLAVGDALVEARAAARQDGGAWLWPVTSDEDWSQPLGDGPREIEALHVLTEEEVTVLREDLDARSKRWSRPEYVQVMVKRDGLSQVVPRMHASRLIYVPGAPSTATQRTAKKGYDIPVLELYREAIDGWNNGGNKVSRLLERLSMPWVKLKKGQAAAASGDDYESKLQLLKEGMGAAGLLVLLGEDEAGWAGPSLAGVRDAVNVLAERVSAVEGFPLTYFFGQPPGGLSTDDASGKRATHAALGRERRMLGKVLLELYAFGLGPDAKRKIMWPSLDKPTAVEEAQISMMRAQRDAALASFGAIGPDESRGRFTEGEELPLPLLADDSVFTELPEVPELPHGSEGEDEGTEGDEGIDDEGIDDEDDQADHAGASAS